METNQLPLFAERVFIGFPKTADEFIKQHSFKDEKKLYTDGSDLIPVSRVEQMLNHYFHYFLEKENEDGKEVH